MSDATLPRVDNTDLLWRFLFEGLPIRGALVQIGPAWIELLKHREYPAAVRDLLGEAMAAAPLLASNIKFEGRLTLQIEGDGPVKLLLVQIDSTLEMRGVARYADNPPEGNVPALFGNGRFGMIIDPVSEGERYQAVVPLVGERLQESVTGYFTQSEQLLTILQLAAGWQGLAGLMLQRMPAEQSDEVDEAWQRLGILVRTLGQQELLSVPPPELLRRLFNEEDYRIFDPQPVTLRCRCSHGRISEMLLSLGRTEVDGVLSEKGEMEIECGFCGRRYTYTTADVHALFGAQESAPPTESRH